MRTWTTWAPVPSAGLRAASTGPRSSQRLHPPRRALENCVRSNADSRSSDFPRRSQRALVPPWPANARVRADGGQRPDRGIRSALRRWINVGHAANSCFSAYNLILLRVNHNHYYQEVSEPGSFRHIVNANSIQIVSEGRRAAMISRAGLPASNQPIQAPWATTSGRQVEEHTGVARNLRLDPPPSGMSAVSSCRSRRLSARDHVAGV